MAAICHTPIFEVNAPDPDAQLMLRVKQGDGSALDELIRKYRAPIIRYVYRMIHDAAEAEDITQEVFLKVHRYRCGYEATAKFGTWLYRIAGRVTLNWIRDNAHSRALEPLENPRTRRSHGFTDGTIRIDEWLLRQCRLDEIRCAMDELPARQREILVLHKIRGIGCEEIGGMLGCSHQAVRSVLFRAYANLRTLLAARRANAKPRGLASGARQGLRPPLQIVPAGAPRPGGGRRAGRKGAGHTGGGSRASIAAAVIWNATP
jgi:RNA polymerase sigma-70 factor, ECF subfamily